MVGVGVAEAACQAPPDGERAGGPRGSGAFCFKGEGGRSRRGCEGLGVKLRLGESRASECAGQGNEESHGGSRAVARALRPGRVANDGREPPRGVELLRPVGQQSGPVARQEGAHSIRYEGPFHAQGGRTAISTAQRFSRGQQRSKPRLKGRRRAPCAGAELQAQVVDGLEVESNERWSRPLPGAAIRTRARTRARVDAGYPGRERLWCGLRCTDKEVPTKGGRCGHGWSNRALGLRPRSTARPPGLNSNRGSFLSV